MPCGECVLCLYLFILILSYIHICMIHIPRLLDCLTPRIDCLTPQIDTPLNCMTHQLIASNTLIPSNTLTPNSIPQFPNKLTFRVLNIFCFSSAGPLFDSQLEYSTSRLFDSWAPRLLDFWNPRFMKSSTHRDFVASIP